MNEEVQSTNEQLSALNQRLEQGSEDFEQANVYLRSILGSLSSAVVVMDRFLQVKLWNEKGEDLWGLRSDEAIGRPFLELDIGLPVGELRQPLMRASRKVTAPGSWRSTESTVAAVRCATTCARRRCAGRAEPRG